MHNVVFTYKECERSELENDHRFQEEGFRNMLEKVFRMKIGIQRVAVTFNKNGSRFTTVVEGIHHGEGIVAKEEGYEASEVAYKAIHTFIKRVQSLNDKIKGN